MYPALSVSLDYPFLVALSVVSNVYLSCVPSVANVSGLPILGCPCRLSLTFIYLVYPALSVSLDYPFLVALSVVSNVIILCTQRCQCPLDYPFLVALSVVSGLPILGCPVGCL